MEQRLLELRVDNHCTLLWSGMCALVLPSRPCNPLTNLSQEVSPVRVLDFGLYGFTRGGLDLWVSDSGLRAPKL